jgi:hypothetical protein
VIPRASRTRAASLRHEHALDQRARRHPVEAGLPLGQGLDRADQRPRVERLFLTERGGSPVVSPHGKWVVVPVIEPAYDAKEVGFMVPAKYRRGFGHQRSTSKDQY